MNSFIKVVPLTASCFVHLFMSQIVILRYSGLNITEYLSQLILTMWLVANVAGINGLPVIRLHSTVSRASADIYLFGATLTSWADKNGVENIFVSSQAIFNGVKAIRGGTYSVS